MKFASVLAFALCLGVAFAAETAAPAKEKAAPAPAASTESGNKTADAVSGGKDLATAAKAKDQSGSGEAVVQEEEDDGMKPKIYRRIIPADVLRDFPQHCFASTLCKLFEPNQDWSLEPFCGQSHCHYDEEHGQLFEIVLDCGPKPTNPDKCKILKPANVTDHFPGCCDVYDQATCTFPAFKFPEAVESSPSAGAEEVAEEHEEPTTTAPQRPARVRGRRPPQTPEA